MTNDRMILFPGGFAAAFLCLVMLTGCPGPMPGTDAGMPPDDDGGMPLDDGDVPPPDSGMPPDDDGGTDAGMVDECTPSMMEMRVTPPCDPDTRTGAGSGPTGLEGYVGPSTSWFSPRGGCGSGLAESPDSMSRIMLEMGCGENATIEPYRGLYYYDRDGLWYANYQNRATQEWSRMSFDIHPEFGPQSASVELFHAGEDVPYLTFMVTR
jgi:hypothetical protein